MAKAKELQMPAVAMTDHGNLYGAIDFYTAAKKAKIKPIIGCEAYLAPGSMFDKKDVQGRKRSSHLTLLSSSNQGFENLSKLITRAHLDGFYYKPRIDKEALREFSAGLICLSGCINGEINEFLLTDREDEAKKSLFEFLDIFGKENFYLEMHDHGMEAQRRVNAKLMQWAKENDLKLVAANDVHFLEPEHHESHDIMICIGTNSKQLSQNRLTYSPEVYFKTAEQMRKLFAHCPEACDSTLEIAERCSLDIELDATSIAKYPQYPVELGVDRNQMLRDMCTERLAWRYGEERAKNDTMLHERMDFELALLKDKNFTSYFLIVWDFIHWAKKNGIPVGPGRGSGAGSLVAYLLGITDLDPIRFGLVFERFLNPERVSPPDFDIDFCQARRGEVIEYVRRKYGERSVSHIITFGTMGAKSVVRDVARALDWSFTDSDKLAKMIPAELNMDLDKAVKMNPELKALIENDTRTQELWKHALVLEGLTRGTGIHAAGIVIGDRELDNFIALTRGNEEEIVSQYAMGPLTELGMLKMDFLGLKTLTVIEEAEQWVRLKVPGFSSSNIPLDDVATFDLLKRGETVAVFQMESGGMVNTCRQLGPDKIEEIIAILALYRPGPMQFIPLYIARKKGEESVEYAHPLLEQISAETYGILVYQEQVMQAASLLAGYTLGQADMLRRAMGKKKPEEMAKQRAVFVEGCQRHNQIPEPKAHEIFNLLEKFAEYGFNKSHSAAYGIVTYRTAYLKANFPVEFMAGVLSLEVSNTDKIANFVSECQRMGIDILPPDVNNSALKFSPEDIGGGKQAIRYGLSAIKNVGGAAMEMALEERASGGPFKSIDDFAKRLDSKVVNKKTLESLIKVGAFDFSGETRLSLFTRLDQVIAAAASAQKDRKSGQGSLFDFEFAAVPVAKADEPAKKSKKAKPEIPAEWSKMELIGFEKELLGFYVSGHPLDAYRGHFDSSKYVTIAGIEEITERKTINVAGLLTAVDIRYTKKDNKAFATLKLEDFTGAIECMVWSDTYEQNKELLVEGNVVAMRTTCEKDQRTEMNRLTAREIKPLQPKKARQRSADELADPEFVDVAAKETETAQSETCAPPLQALVLRLDVNRHSEEDLIDLQKTLLQYPGNTPVHLRCLRFNGSVVTLELGAEYRVANNKSLAIAMADWLNY